MSGIVVRSFGAAEERVTFDHGYLDLVTASSLALVQTPIRCATIRRPIHSSGEGSDGRWIVELTFGSGCDPGVFATLGERGGRLRRTP